MKGQPQRFIRGHVSKKGKPPEYLVDPESGCWVWQRYVDPSTGYGNLTRGTPKMRYTAHRYFWEQVNGPVPDGMELDHGCHSRAVAADLCDGGVCIHRRCCNPDHMELVTRADNIQRSRATPLTVGLAQEIRDLQRSMSGPAVAKLYGVTPPTIYSIWNGASWVTAAVPLEAQRVRP